MRLIDTHTHLDFDDFDADRAQVLQRGQQAGVERVVVLGVYRRNWQRVWDLAQTEPGVYAALGLHPIYIEEHQDAHLQALHDWFDTLKGHPKLCAVGEIGLDYYVEGLDQARQRQVFDAQLALAAEFGLPPLLHARRSHADVIAALKRARLERPGIVHAFSGSGEEAREYLKLGFKFGLGGAGTWPQAKRMHRVLPELPLNAVVLETDCPDMAPAMHPGVRNSPEHLPDICAALAAIMGVDTERLAEHSTRNACEVFGWAS